MKRIMVQKTRTTTKTDTVEEDVPSQVSDTSSQVSEDACCVLADIDSLLDEVVVPVLEEWDQEFDPAGKRPNKAKWLEQYRYLYKINSDVAWDHWQEFRNREEAWHSYRGLTWNSCTC